MSFICVTLKNFLLNYLNLKEMSNFINKVIVEIIINDNVSTIFNSVFYLEIRDNLQVKSYALPEHCRSITINRIIYPRLAQSTSVELNSILRRLRRLIDL